MGTIFIDVVPKGILIVGVKHTKRVVLYTVEHLLHQAEKYWFVDF